MNTFSPKDAVTFDVAKGEVRTAGRDRTLLVTSEGLAALLAEAPLASRRKFGAAVGKSVGATIAARAGSGLLAGSLEGLTTELAGELSVRGFGLVSIEQWGRAIVFHLENSAVGDGDVISAVLEGALAAMTGKPVFVTSLGNGRHLFSGEAAAARARDMVGAGADYRGVLLKLQDRS